jgi:hypothetical protein
MSQELIDKIRAASQAKGVDPEVALRIARAESGLKVNATPGTSSAGGLFQVVDKTWKEFGGKPGKKFDPDENIRVGTDIIAKNAQTLKAFLNRDPRPAEIYAAHYFGPTGAKSFLSAEPGTPMESLFPASVIKANPNLKGKTSDQVMASLEKKMGGKPAAPTVSRETSAPAATPSRALPPSLPPMAAAGTATVAAAPMKEQVANLGPGYQAALALSFLADTDEKEDRDVEKEPGIAEQWLAQTASRPAALAQFADISIKSPFQDEPVQPQMLADGGEVESMQGEARKGEAYQALEKYLQSRDEMPSIKVTSRMPEGTDGIYTSDNLNIGSGTIKINKNTPKAALSSLLTHEMTHAADRQMKQQAIEQGMFGKSNQYTEAYKKLVGPEGRNRTELARLLKPEWAAENRLYRADPKEIAAHGVGAFAGPTLQTRGPRHVDATAATEFRILMDLAQRNVDKGPTGLEKIPAFFRKMGRYSDGGDVQQPLTPQQIERIAAQEAMEREEASRPATVNPNIQRQGEAARRLAAMRDVNTLPDPRTYAAVSGFLGQAPDEMGFSVMHPDREGIKKAGEAGFYAGTALQVAPLVGGAMKLANLAPSSGGKATAAQQLGAIKVPGRASEPIFTPTPSADAPFVGRLDEMVANLQGPVQKDQFLGMLKGKMRDYDIARAETTLADLPGNAKLNPVDLLNRIKTQYDPSQFKTTVVPPGSKISNYQSSDNPYQGATGDGPPLGVIHLSQSADPMASQIDEIRDMANNALFRLGSSSAFHSHRSMQLKTANDLLRAANSPALGLSESTANGMRTLGTQYRQIALQRKAIDDVLKDIFYPATDPDYVKKTTAYADEFDSQGVSPSKSYYDATVRFTKEKFEENNNILRDNNLPTVPVPDFASAKNPVLWAIEDTPRAKELKAQVLDFLKNAENPLNEALETMKGSADELMGKFQTEIKRAPPYKGQHTALRNSPDNPISFSRFSEHTTDIPGIGKADGIYVNELQSDLLDDLRKKGVKGGSLEKDEKKLRELEDSIKGITDPTERQAIESKMRNLRTRLFEGMGPNNTPNAGFYELSGSFPGMESSPQVTQQLMVKNAVSGAMQMGKQFVAFPGAESAQAQLYEKLGPNLKSVVKDLGPGFELRDVTLRDPDGKQLMHKAIVWGPDAAARVQKKGVPFKDGGAVERQTADHRKYL